MQQLNRNLRERRKAEMYVVICLLIVDAGLGAIRTTVKNISSRVHVVKRCAARAAEGEERPRNRRGFVEVYTLITRERR